MIRIAITGPECSGKSQLSMELVRYLGNSKLVPEFARSYLEAKPAGYEYTTEDLKLLSNMHFEAFESLENEGASYLIADTEFLVLSIWMEEVFHRNDELIESRFEKCPFDLFLLCAPDIPWVHDPLRENPLDRDRLFKIYKRRLDLAGKKVVVIQGNQRLDAALAALKAMKLRR